MIYSMLQAKGVCCPAIVCYCYLFASLVAGRAGHESANKLPIDVVLPLLHTAGVGMRRLPPALAIVPSGRNDSYTEPCC